MSNRRQFGCIENKLYHTGTIGNARKRTGAQGKDVIMPDKGHHECPINAQTSTHTPSPVVIAAVICL